MMPPISPPRRRQFLQWLLSTGAYASLPGTLVGCGPAVPAVAGQWTNAVGTLKVRPASLMLPSSAAELIAIVKQAESAHKRVRMTGSGHSFSDVALADDYLLLPSRLDRILDLDRSTLKAPFASDKHLIRVESGITLRKLNSELDARQLALENLGGYDGQTIAGVAMTATHGSGFHYGPIASQIVSIQMVVSGGEVWQIEPSNGITARKETLDDDPQIKVVLKQDDDLFAAASVSMGCMGIVYAVVLKTVDKFWIRERRSIVSFADLIKSGGKLDRIVKGDKINDSGEDPDHYEVYFNPYSTAKTGSGGHTCIYNERYRLSEPPSSPSPDSMRRASGDTASLLDNPEIVKFAGNALRSFLDGATPATLHGFIDIMLEVLRDDDYTDLGYRVFNLGDANRFRAYGIEAAFDAKDTIAATERTFALAAENEKRGWNHSVPISLRFVAPSTAHLAMQYGRRTCMMEIGMLVGARGAGEMLKAYETTFMREFGARPHWGLDLDVLTSQDDVARLYPAWPKWKAAYDLLNKNGAFNGRVTDRLGISRPQG